MNCDVREELLHRARLARRLDLTEMAARTALSPAVLKKIDEGRFGELPAGLYARSYVRSFAAEVGLDPTSAVRDLEDLLPHAPDPMPALQEIARATSPELWPMARCAAVATDAMILFAINSTLMTLVSVCSGIPVEFMLKDTAPALTSIFSVPVLAYFVVFAGIGGRTPGASLWQVPPPPRTPLTLSVILQRTFAPLSLSASPQLTEPARSR